VDVGLTNLLMIDQPGMHGLFNYWSLTSRITDQTAPIAQAESRLKKWFTFVDQITASKPLDPPVDHHGAYVVCDDTLLYEHGNLFTPRLNDYYKPFVHHVDQSDMRVDSLHARDIDEQALQGRPWVYVPYASDLLSKQVVDALTQYVQKGGTLIMEAGSGKWLLNGDRKDALGHALGLGDWQAHKTDASEIIGQWQNAGVLQSATLKLRTQPWNPPIDTQPTPWIHNIARSYFQVGTWVHGDKGTILATDQQSGKPILTKHILGGGGVLLFDGVVDWLNSPGLIKAIQFAVTGQSQDQTQPQDESQELIKREFIHGKTYYLVGRRFIGQAQINAIARSNRELAGQPPVNFHIRLADMKADATYHVTDILNDHVYPVQTGEFLMRHGMSMVLKPGQAFVLKFEQE
jgi:hypothetical protein